MATEKARTRKAVVFPPTEEEEIEFWKRHDIADFAEGPADDIVLALQPERKKQVTIRLEPSLVEDLKETAAGVGVPYQTFARHLIKIGLRKFHRDGYG